MGDSTRVSNVASAVASSPSLLPHVAFFFPASFAFCSIFLFTVQWSISLFHFFPPLFLSSYHSSCSVFGRSLKGGHEGDNANTGRLNGEWEEDSCWKMTAMAVKTQSVSLPTGLLQSATARLTSFHRGHHVTATLLTVKHECESWRTLHGMCHLTHTYVNAQTMYNAQLLAHEQWAHAKTHPCQTLDYWTTISTDYDLNKSIDNCP